MNCIYCNAECVARVHIYTKYFLSTCDNCQVSFKFKYSQNTELDAIALLIFSIREGEIFRPITHYLVIDPIQNTTKLFGRTNFDKPIINLSYAMDVNPDVLQERLLKLKKLIIFT